MKIKPFFEAGYKGHLIALLAGFLMAFSFAPFSCFPLPFVSFALLLSSLIYVNQRDGFWRGLLFGLGLYGVGVSWVYNSIHVYGNTPVWIATAITALFVLILALVPATFAYLFTRFFPKNDGFKLLGAFPSIWFFTEWVKGWFFGGFPWLDIGYTQIDSPLRHYAPYIGSYGLSFLVALGAGLIVYACLTDITKCRRNAVIGFLLMWLIAPAFSLYHFTHPAGKPEQVTIIQGNIAPMKKWDPAQLKKTMALYKDITEKHWNSRIIVWPESALPIFKENITDYLTNLSKEATEHNTAIILGIPTQTIISRKMYNSLIVLGDGHGKYNKRHLVPFGEFTPDQDWIKSIMTYLNLPMPNLSMGHFLQTPPYAAGIRLSPLICYESAFASLLRVTIGKDQLIVTLSDDLWFGHSWAVEQHLQMTQMRALETGRFAIFSNNNGRSAIISPRGNIEVSAPNNAQAVVSGAVVPMEGSTPWTLVGLNIHMVIMLYLIAFAVRMQYYNPEESGGKAV